MLLVFALANGDAQRAVLNGAVDGDREIERILKFEVELDGAARGAASSDGGIYAVRGICRAAGAVRVAIDDGNALRELEQGVIKRCGNLTGAAARARDRFAVDQHGGILVAAALAIRPGDRVKIKDIARSVGSVDIAASDADVFHAPQIQLGGAQ